MTGMRASLSRGWFIGLSIAITILAFVLREYYVNVTEIQGVYRGDIIQYVAYAYNMVHSGIYSSVWPGTAALVPDAYRGPGYSLFLSSLMLARPLGDDWYYATLDAQAFLGAATVLLGIALGRFWLSRASALLAGMLMAVWPHSIAATSALLSEVVFGFVVMLAIFATANASRRDNPAWAILAGLAFGYAILINQVILFFPFLAALFFWIRARRRVALWLVVLPVLAMLAWSARTLTLPPDTSPGRASMNIVQGSWPDMHAAWNYRLSDPSAAAFIARIESEEKLVAADPIAGFSVVGRRLLQQPAYYFHWYVVEKPYLLWDWDIRTGSGDVYVQEVKNSPLNSNPVLHGIKDLLHRLNFVLFCLSGAAALVLAWRVGTAPVEDVAGPMVGTLCIYVTIVHVIFQAEPRYSIPYRPLQLLLLVTALVFVVSWIRRWRDSLRGIRR